MDNRSEVVGSGNGNESDIRGNPISKSSRQLSGLQHDFSGKTLKSLHLLSVYLCQS